MSPSSEKSPKGLRRELLLIQVAKDGLIGMHELAHGYGLIGLPGISRGAYQARESHAMTQSLCMHPCMRLLSSVSFAIGVGKISVPSYTSEPFRHDFAADILGIQDGTVTSEGAHLPT